MAANKKQIVFVDIDRLFLEKAKNFSSRLDHLIVTTPRIEDLVPLLDKNGENIDVIAINIDPYSTNQIRELKKQLNKHNWTHIKILSISEPDSKCSAASIEKIKELSPLGLLNKSHGAERQLFKINDAIFYDSAKRKNRRTILRVPIKCSCKDYSFKAQTYSISRDGIFVQTDETIPHDQDVTIDFVLPQSEENFKITCSFLYELRGETQALRLAPSGVGLLFKTLEDSKRNVIDKYVKENQ